MAWHQRPSPLLPGLGSGKTSQALAAGFRKTSNSNLGICPAPATGSQLSGRNQVAGSPP